MSASGVEIDPVSRVALDNFLLQFHGGLNSISAIADRRAALDSVTKKISEFEELDIEVVDESDPVKDGVSSRPKLPSWDDIMFGGSKTEDE